MQYSVEQASCLYTGEILKTCRRVRVWTDEAKLHGHEGSEMSRDTKSKGQRKVERKHVGKLSGDFSRSLCSMCIKCIPLRLSFVSVNHPETNERRSGIHLIHIEQREREKSPDGFPHAFSPPFLCPFDLVSLLISDPCDHVALPRRSTPSHEPPACLQNLPVYRHDACSTEYCILP